MLVERKISEQVLLNLDKYPIVFLIGPRQSGKTTLCKMLKPDYANLEDISLREFAGSEHKGFLET